MHHSFEFIRRIGALAGGVLAAWLDSYVVWHSPRLAVAALEAMRRGRDD